MSSQSTEKDYVKPDLLGALGRAVERAREDRREAVHWGHADSRPTSLHGNGAASFEHTTLDPDKVTCRLCVTLLANSESLAWVDRQGDVWRVGDDGLMHTPETAPLPREYAEKKWGPLRLVDTRFPPGAST